MVFVVLTLAAALVAAVAFVAVGSVVGRGESQARVAVFDLVDALDAVADHLPESLSARLSYEELEQVIVWYVAYLEERGVAFDRGDGPDQREDLFDVDVHLDLDLDPEADAKVVTDAHALAFVMLKVGESDLELDDGEVTEITELVDGYLSTIGAVGPVADSPTA